MDKLKLGKFPNVETNSESALHQKDFKFGIQIITLFKRGSEKN
jgi:hypothetical protein